jgi:hypothetical protein
LLNRSAVFIRFQTSRPVFRTEFEARSFFFYEELLHLVTFGRKVARKFCRFQVVSQNKCDYPLQTLGLVVQAKQIHPVRFPLCSL